MTSGVRRPILLSRDRPDTIAAAIASLLSRVCAMTPFRDNSAGLVIVALVLAMVSTGQIAAAQDDDVAEDDRNVPAAAAVVAPQPNLEQVDNWVFGRVGGAAFARTRFDAALTLRIDDLQRACGLTDAQSKKLRLAGRGDIKRVFDRVEELKRTFQRSYLDPNNNIWQVIQPLRVEVNGGPFGDGSIFQKTIKKTLTDLQLACYDSLLRERRLSRHRSTVEWFVVNLDQVLGLSDDQRRRITELIMSDTEVSPKLGQSDYWYLMFEISRLPEAKFKPIFDAPQWRLLSRQLIQARNMEPWLRTSGLLPDHKQNTNPPVPLRERAP
jgi:hypothetical protein